MAEIQRRTLLTWFKKESLNHLAGMQDIGKMAVDQFLPRLKGYSFTSGVYLILKEEERKLPNTPNKTSTLNGFCRIY